MSAEAAVRLQIVERAQHCAFAGTGFGHKRAANGTNEKLSSALLASRIRMKALIGDTTSESVAQSTGSGSRCRDGQ